jgi:molybdopterin-guanine dinucleotide biosynthesis protein A
MIGLVLCGGKSSRMGSDKGLLTIENISWVELALSKLKALHIRTAISLRADQVANYHGLVNDALIIQDNAELSYHGPLIGLMSAHQVFPNEDLLLLACDMPEMELTTLISLVQHQQTNPTYQAYCFLNQGNMEPLAAIYTSAGLSVIHEKYLANNLPKHSMKYVLSAINTLSTPLDQAQQKSFQNFNTPTDLFNL